MTHSHFKDPGLLCLQHLHINKTHYLLMVYHCFLFPTEYRYCIPPVLHVNVLCCTRRLVCQQQVAIINTVQCTPHVTQTSRQILCLENLSPGLWIVSRRESRHFYFWGTVLRSRSRWSRNYLGPRAGAEIKFLINISAVSLEDGTMKISSFLPLLV